MNLIDVPSTQLFTPSGVQTFGIVDPTGLNASLTAAASGFLLTNSVVTGDTQLSATVRNVEVYTSFAAASVLITLPASPQVGDPPCNVSFYYLGGFSANWNVIITTSDSTPINGIIPNAGLTNCPSLFSPGDTLRFTYAGGSMGWIASGQLNALLLAAPFTRGASPWQGQTLMVTAGTYPVEALQVAGAFAYVCKRSGALSVFVGDSTSTFNGSIGPYTIAAGSNDILYKFTCLGNRAFLVTT